MVPARCSASRSRSTSSASAGRSGRRGAGETEYGVKAVPLGGYVKMVGMLPPGAGGQDPADGHVAANTGMFQPAGLRRPRRGVRARRARRRGPAVLPAGVVEEGHRDGRGGPLDEPGARRSCFRDRVHGARRARSTQPTVSHVSDCVIAATAATADQPPRHCRPSDPVAPAKRPGCSHGDTIVAFNGTPINTWDQLTSADPRQPRRPGHHRRATATAQLTTLHTNTTVSARPQSAERPHQDRPGRLPRASARRSALERTGPGFVVSTMGDYTWRTGAGHRPAAGQGRRAWQGRARPAAPRRRTAR